MIEADAHDNRIGDIYDPNVFMDEVLLDTDGIILRKPIKKDKDIFYELKKSGTYVKAFYNKPDIKEELWDEHLSKRSLFYTIEEKGSYIGYCGVKDVRMEIWEVAIELLDKYRHQGYGYKALSGLLHEVAELAGRHDFSSCVDPDNIASQKLMEKIGFQPYGITKFLLYDEEEIRQCEEKYADRIDCNYIELAKKFHTEPRKLLSHILEYRIHV